MSRSNRSLQYRRHASVLKPRPRHNPPGSKLVKRFIRDASGESTAYRLDLFRLTG